MRARERFEIMLLATTLVVSMISMKTIWLVPALVLLSLLSPAFAQSTQTSYTVNLNEFSLQVSFPSEAMPSDTVTVNVQGTPKANSASSLQSLTVTIYYAGRSGPPSTLNADTHQQFSKLFWILQCWILWLRWIFSALRRVSAKISA